MQGNAEEGPRIVATTSILGDIVRNSVGDAATVEVLMGAGVDPHSFQPSIQQIAALREADVVVAVGLDLEEPLLDALAAAEEAGVEVLRVGEAVDPIPYALAEGGRAEEGHAEEEHADADDGYGAVDPHVWFDPLRIAEASGLIADAVAEVAPRSADEVRGAARAYAEELRTLDRELADRIDTIPEARRVLITNHDAIGYLAARYDLEILGAVIPGGSTLASTSSGALAELTDLIRDEGVPAIFSENTASDELLQTLAREVGRDVEVVSLYTDALGPAGSGAETYVELLRTDVELIVGALTGGTGTEG